MKTSLEIVKDIVESLILPTGCALVAEARIADDLPFGMRGARGRKNLCLDVTGRMPRGIAKYADVVECSEEEVFYLRMQSELRDEISNLVFKLLGSKRRALGSFMLTYNRNEGTELYCHERGVLLVRSELASQDENTTEWNIDMFLVVYDAALFKNNDRAVQKH